MKGKNIVVTGGMGFIGSHIVEELIKQGASKVTIIDNLLTGNIENIKELNSKKINFIKGDITNLDLKTIFDNQEYVFHEAALVSVPESINNPYLTNKVNIDGSFNIFQAACKNNIKKVVSASSAAVYGETKILPNVETLPLNPLSPYAVSKATMELYSYTFTHTYNLPTICLRYFNVFGPRQKVDSAYSGVIPRFITTLLSGKQPIIYGDGSQTRDFVFVKNIAEANLKIAKTDATGIYNIAHGNTININELLLRICDIMGYDFNPKYEESREGDIKNSVADISKAQKTFGYENEHDFNKELKETINYYKNEFKRTSS